MIPRPTEARLVIEDEPRDFEYLVRVVFTLDPAAGESDVRIERVEVLEARQLADDGRVLVADTSPSVRKHDERIWELLEDDPPTLSTVEEECRAAASSTGEHRRAVTGSWMRHVDLPTSHEQRGAG